MGHNHSGISTTVGHENTPSKTQLLDFPDQVIEKTVCQGYMRSSIIFLVKNP